LCEPTGSDLSAPSQSANIKPFYRQTWTRQQAARMPRNASGDDHVFTIRLWREHGGAGRGDQQWRGRLYHSQSSTTRHLVGFDALFDLIRELSQGADPAASPGPPP
jgi:hypothetical protein